MASFSIRKGLDIKLAGAPEAAVQELPDAASVAVIPAEFGPIKPRLDVQEGARVKRGQSLFHDKNRPALRGVAPAAGVVSSIVYGPRRVIEKIIVTREGADEAEAYPRFDPAAVKSADRAKLLEVLQSTGLINLIRQRPFGRAANPDATPKSIFVNGMATAPFQADINAVIKGREIAFQAGLDAMTRLTAGKVFLCLGPGAKAAALAEARNVEVHTFDGPHPAGNTSVHISRLDPMKPTDIVWTIKAVDLLQIGHLLLNGETPSHRVVALGGPGVAEGARRHYSVRIGAPLSALLQGRTADGELRVIRGDALSGDKTGADDVVRLTDTAFTVLKEDRERHLLGWLMPGFKYFSVSRAFVSPWLGGLNKEWALGTNQHGELRPMVLTGVYDKYMPLNIMVDYVVRAVLANDTEEAVKLGILETLPEDYALCAFACLSKMDLVGIIRKGLADIEKEGI
jgi:Na+-transporting NADH:ubiquinone oxidoreductase subunit A